MEEYRNDNYIFNLPEKDQIEVDTGEIDVEEIPNGIVMKRKQDQRMSELFPDIPLYNGFIRSDMMQFSLVTTGLKFLAETIKSATGRKLFEMFKEIIFPGSSTKEMDALLAEVETLLEKTLQAEKEKELQAIYKGMNDVADLFIRAQNAALDAQDEYRMMPTRENLKQLQTERALAADYFKQLHVLFVARLPEFEIAGYEEISLPLFVQMCTLHLTLLKEGVLTGTEWGLTDKEIASFRDDFYRLVGQDTGKGYPQRAFKLYHTAFDRTFASPTHADTLLFRTVQTFSALDYIYLWSLMRYGGIAATFSRTVFQFIGPDLQIKKSAWKDVYKMHVGSPNGTINKFYLPHTDSPQTLKCVLSGILPVYTLNKVDLGYVKWLGINSGFPPISTTIANPLSKVDINYRAGTGKMRLIIGGAALVHGGADPGSNIIQFQEHSLRTLSVLPSDTIPAYNFSLLHLEAPVTWPNKYVGNIVAGFTPTSNNAFYRTGKHTIGYNQAYSIPPLQFNYLRRRSDCYLEDELDQGSDGALRGTMPPGDFVNYFIDLKHVAGQTYRFFYRDIGGSGAIAVRVRGQSASDGVDITNITSFSRVTPDVVPGHYDYISEPFVMLQNDTIGYATLTIVKLDDRFVHLSQLMLIPDEQYKQLL